MIRAKKPNEIDLKARIVPQTGEWGLSEQINIWDVETKDIYRSPEEPSFVSWAILWKESDGTLKLSFTEAVGDPVAWPPSYNPNRPGTEYYLKTIVSKDEGSTWSDTNWREGLDKRWQFNLDHHVRHVIQLDDGSLLRNYCHTLEGQTSKMVRFHYDVKKPLDPFPFTQRNPGDCHTKTASIWRSNDGGETWQEMYVFPPESGFFVTSIHQLNDGTITAFGAFRGQDGDEKCAMTESKDRGSTWCEPYVVLENDDKLLSQGMGNEGDFVELPDGRLLMVERTDALGVSMNMLRVYYTRERSGRWAATEIAPIKESTHSGHPYLWRTSDGTIFYYSILGILYSCDEGHSWHELELGRSYYGQLVESCPGRIVAVTHTQIGDGPYPWQRDTSMEQTRFRFARTPVATQSDSQQLEARAILRDTQSEKCHVYAEMRLDGQTGILFGAKGSDYGFAAVVVPCNEFRTPGRDLDAEQDALLVVGTSEGGVVTLDRRIYLGKVPLRSWVPMQLSVAEGLLKVAVRPTPKTGPYYAVIRAQDKRPGQLGLFTNRSSGAFRNLELDSRPKEIRSSWR